MSKVKGKRRKKSQGYRKNGKEIAKVWSCFVVGVEKSGGEEDQGNENEYWSNAGQEGRRTEGV